MAETAEKIWSYIQNTVQSLRITDIIDVMVVAFLIYKAMMFFRRSGSARVLKGIVLIVVPVWILSWMQMHVINFLLGKTMELGVIALLILFQPEVRKALERMGSSNLGFFFGKQINTKETENAIMQTVIACRDMSKSKTGALIIFERKIRLEDPEKTGTMIDAEVTSELLKNIFYPKAPLHDGAAIIKDGRIGAAGCMLPLSSNPNLSRELGMRHRAGIGISEVSDAVVVVVSEETGAISVAVDGMLKRHLSLEIFEKILRNELLGESESNQKPIGKMSRISKVRKNAKRNSK